MGGAALHVMSIDTTERRQRRISARRVCQSVSCGSNQHQQHLIGMSPATSKMLTKARRACDSLSASYRP